MRTILLLGRGLILMMIGLPSSFAADPSTAADLATEIKAMEAEILKFKQSLEDTKSERSDLESKVEEAEKNINSIQQKIKTIESDLKSGEEKVSRLEAEKDQWQQRMVEQQEHIGEQIRAAYKLGRQEYLKMVLNQEDPHQVSRMLTHYDYVNRARVEEIQGFRHTIAQVAKVSTRIAEENRRLASQRLVLGEQQVQLESEQDGKLIVLQALNRQLVETGSELAKATADRSRLEQLLARIQSRTANLPTEKDSTGFEGMKGQLLLPVTGIVSRQFGANRNAGKMRWRGVFIDAPEGEPVHAVHYGRVVFSEWLRGFGLLLIVNHGKGYMSLYGHNQMVYRETGDWVIAGEMIAAVGDTGGQSRPGLYFEIRIDGTPADPQLWCQVRGNRPA